MTDFCYCVQRIHSATKHRFGPAPPLALSQAYSRGAKQWQRRVTAMRRVSHRGTASAPSRHTSCRAGRLTTARVMPAVAWRIPLGVAQASHPSRRRRVGELHSSHAATLSITWMGHACSLSRVSPTRRRPRSDGRHQQRCIALSSLRRRRSTLSAPEVARHWQG